MNDRFVVLTGHLNNYPLSDLIGILRHQRKSGRLLIEYAKGPATFFFQNGELIDARMNELTGLQALVVAMSQPEAAFNFNPLIQSSRRSIEPSLQRVVSELLGCWDESALQIEARPVVTELPVRPEPLALPPARTSSLVQQRSVFLVAAVLIGVGVSTVIAVTGGFKAENAAAPPSVVAQPMAETTIPAPAPPVTTKPARAQSVSKKRNTEKTSEPAAVSEPSAQPIRVVMHVENGRVLKASIANPKAGMESYEALALRIARQRRFASTTNGGETVTITVRPQQ
jgi:hypothetical protein